MNYLSNLHIIMPEIIISISASIVLLINLKSRPGHINRSCFLVSIIGIIISIVVSQDQLNNKAAYGLSDFVFSDGLSNLLKIVILTSTLIVIIYSRQYARGKEFWRNEYLVLMLFGCVGMMVIVGANHLLTLYIGIELLALNLYALIAMQRSSMLAAEAAMKYFILGALASGIMLYGMSLIYGLVGSLSFDDIKAASTFISVNSLPLIVAVILILSGMLFKVGAVPFHMWVPDIYDGSSTSTTLYLSAVPKLAAFAIFLRVLFSCFFDWHEIWRDALFIAAVMSVGLGNIIAIAQTRIKRMLAYSTIAHMGFLLLGFATLSVDGITASFFYAVIYSVSTMAIFGLIIFVGNSDSDFEEIINFSGLSKTQPWCAFLILITMLSLAGIPPTAGFFAKLLILQSLVDSGHVVIATIIVLLTVIGAFYYLRIIKIVYFDNASEPAGVLTKKMSDLQVKILLSVNALLLIFVVPWIGDFLDWTFLLFESYY